MKTIEAFNPLDHKKIIQILIEEFEKQSFCKMPLTDKFIAQGVYGIYCYQSLDYLKNSELDKPIYIGKAVYGGSRKGQIKTERPALFDRLNQHAKSIQLAENLNINSFYCRYLSLDDLWIATTESELIKYYKPHWNNVLEGFGNRNGLNKTRNPNNLSKWDQQHPGRRQQ